MSAAEPSPVQTGPDAAAVAERLRRRYPPPRVPRRVAFGLVGVVAAVFLVWLVWSGLVIANPAVSGQILRYEVTADTEVAFTLTVDRPDPSVPATCRVIAQATNFERVGTLDIAAPPDPNRLVDITQTMKTFRRATSVSVDRCWTG